MIRFWICSNACNAVPRPSCHQTRSSAISWPLCEWKRAWLYCDPNSHCAIIIRGTNGITAHFQLSPVTPYRCVLAFPESHIMTPSISPGVAASFSKFRDIIAWGSWHVAIFVMSNSESCWHATKHCHAYRHNESGRYDVQRNAHWRRLHGVIFSSEFVRRPLRLGQSLKLGKGR